MKDPAVHHRRSIRLQGYDYGQPGAYFVTICTSGRECILGKVSVGVADLSPYGRIVAETWPNLPSHYAGLELDEFIVMPNHVHGIIVLTANMAGAGFKPAPTRFAHQSAPDVPVFESDIVGAGFKPAPAGSAHPPTPNVPPSTPGQTPSTPAPLSEIVRGFKTFSARRINEYRGTRGRPVWQRNYYEHIIRSDRTLNAVRGYIAENPMRWAYDHDNPQRISSPFGVK